MDVAHNDTRGSAQRLGEKRIKIKQATARASSVSKTNDHSSQDRVRALEQQLRAAEQGEQDAQRRCEQLLQEKDRELTEANHRCADMERLLREAQLTVQEANRRETDLCAQITALRSELEGKTKELAAHNTEVWRIPTNKK